METVQEHLEVRTALKTLITNPGWKKLVEIINAQTTMRRQKTNSPTKTFEEVFERNYLIGEVDGMLTVINMPQFVIEAADDFLSTIPQEKLDEAQNAIDGSN